LKNQQILFNELKDRTDLNFNTDDPEMNTKISNELIKIKKVRLIEDKISYEDLAIMDIFSEDEITFDLNKTL
jgi:hypothetical protein